MFIVTQPIVFHSFFGNFILLHLLLIRPTFCEIEKVFHDNSKQQLDDHVTSPTPFHPSPSLINRVHPSLFLLPFLYRATKDLYTLLKARKKACDDFHLKIFFNQKLHDYWYYYMYFQWKKNFKGQIFNLSSQPILPWTVLWDNWSYS